MAKRVTLIIQKSGAPLANAEVIVGDIVGTTLTTNEDGEVLFGVADDFAAYAHILIDLGEGQQAIAYQRMIGGESYQIDIP